MQEKIVKNSDMFISAVKQIIHCMHPRFCQLYIVKYHAIDVARCGGQ